MGREVRRVPKDWQHPKRDGRYIPMYDKSHSEALREYLDDDLPRWLEGWRLWHEEGKAMTYSGKTMTIAECVDDSEPHRRPAEPSYRWWAGEIPSPPSPDNYMPAWPVDQRTHYMMYEDTSEGTPISPAFATPEELARWLADNGASSFGSSTASYEQWLRVAKGGWAPSGVLLPGTGFVSGVEAFGNEPL